MANKKQNESTTMSPEDLAAYLEAAGPPSKGDLAQLQALAELQAVAEAKVAQKTNELEEAKSELAELAERQVPEMMDGLGIKEFKTNTGLYITINETIRASIPKGQEPVAFKWLRDHGHASLIQRVVSVSFGRGEDTKADEFVKQLITDKQMEPADKVGVNSNTLAAFVREMLRDGKEIPQETFGVHRQRVSKVKLPK